MKLNIFLILVLVAELSQGGRRFGGGGGRRSGGFGSSIFGRRSSSSSSRASSYPKQQWGSSSGSVGGSNYPRQQYGGSSGSVGGGGFVKPNGYGSRNVGGGGYGSRGGSSSYGAGGIGGGGFVKPSYGSRSAVGSASAGYSYKAPGYGTNFGTKFTGGVGKYGGKGYSKKALGLGVGAGFIGGAALGAAGAVATMGVYHRYQEFKRLMFMHQYGGVYSNPYYNNYYLQGNCFGGCNFNAYCNFGICQCLPGYTQAFGQCVTGSGYQNQGRKVDPFQECNGHSDCQRIDINLVCNTNVTIQNNGRCQCREDMKWNEATNECQIWLDVDCSSFTYDSKPSQIVLAAVNTTLEKIEKNNSTASTSVAPESITTTTTTTTPEPVVNSENNSTSEANNSSDVTTTTTTPVPSTTTTTLPPGVELEGRDKVLSNSILTSLDPAKASENELKEAFCRDVDTFSWEFAQPQRQDQRAGYNYSSCGSYCTGGLLPALLLLYRLLLSQ